MMVFGYNANGTPITYENAQTTGGITFYTYQIRKGNAITITAYQNEIVTVRMSKGKMKTTGNTERRTGWMKYEWAGATAEIGEVTSALVAVYSSALPMSVVQEYVEAGSPLGGTAVMTIADSLGGVADEDSQMLVGSETMKAQEKDNWVNELPGDENKPNGKVVPPTKDTVVVPPPVIPAAYDEPIDWGWVTAGVAICAVVVLTGVLIVVTADEQPAEEAV